MERKTKVAVAGTTSGLITAAGVGLMFLGPVGMLAGAVVLGAGVSGSVNTIQQGVSENEDFDMGQWGIGVGIGAATGVIAAPFGAAGGAIASTLTSTGAKVGVQVAAGAIGGTVSNGTAHAVQNKYDGKDATEGLGVALLTGAVAGGVGAGIGQGTKGVANALTKGSKDIGAQVTKNAAIRVTAQTVGGGIGAATTGTLTQLISNAINSGEISYSDLYSFLCQHFDKKLDQEEFDKLWDHLKSLGFVRGKTAILTKIDDLKLPKSLQKFHKPLSQLIPDLNDITKDIGKAALIAGIIGAAGSAASAAAQEHNYKNQLKSQIKQYANKTMGKDGEQSSTIDNKVLSQKTGKNAVIHTQEGNVLIKGDGGNEKRTQHRYFDEAHYQPADKNGVPQVSRTNGKNDGNCFMELAKQQMGAKTTQEARQQLQDFSNKDPLNAFKYVTTDELMKGGYLKGGMDTKKGYYDLTDKAVKKWYPILAKKEEEKAKLIKDTTVKKMIVIRDDGTKNGQKIEIEYVRFNNIEDAIFYADPTGAMKESLPLGTKEFGLMADFGKVTGMQVREKGSHYRFDWDPQIGGHINLVECDPVKNKILRKLHIIFPWTEQQKHQKWDELTARHHPQAH